MAGCAAVPQEDPLHLDSVMDLKSQKRTAGETEEPEVPAPMLAVEEDLSLFLEFPGQYRVLNLTEILQLRESSPDLFPPTVLRAWQRQQRDVYITASATAMNAEEVSAMTRPVFLDRMKDVGAVYDDYYTREYKSQSTVDIRDEGALIVVTVTSKFVAAGQWQSHCRIFYLFRPDQRFSITFSGLENHVEDAIEELRPELRKFEALIRKNHPEGIVFSAAN